MIADFNPNFKHPNITRITYISTNSRVGTADGFDVLEMSNVGCSAHNDKKLKEMVEKKLKLKEQRLELEKCRRLGKKMKY